MLQHCLLILTARILGVLPGLTQNGLASRNSYGTDLNFRLKDVAQIDQEKREKMPAFEIGVFALEAT